MSFCTFTADLTLVTFICLVYTSTPAVWTAADKSDDVSMHLILINLISLSGGQQTSAVPHPVILLLFSFYPAVYITKKSK